MILHKSVQAKLVNDKEKEFFGRICRERERAQQISSSSTAAAAVVVVAETTTTKTTMNGGSFSKLHKKTGYVVSENSYKRHSFAVQRRCRR